MPSQNLLLVLRKIADDVRIQVERHHGHVVLRPQLLRKGPRRIQHLHPEHESTRGVLAQQQHGNGRLGAPNPFHLLLHSIFVDAEVIGLETGHELVSLLSNTPTSTVTSGTSTCKVVAGKSAGFLNSGRAGAGGAGGTSSELLLLRQGNHPVIAAGAARCRGRLVGWLLRRWLLLCCRLLVLLPTV